MQNQDSQTCTTRDGERQNIEFVCQTCDVRHKDVFDMSRVTTYDQTPVIEYKCSCGKTLVVDVTQNVSEHFRQERKKRDEYNQRNREHANQSVREYFERINKETPETEIRKIETNIARSVREFKSTKPDKSITYEDGRVLFWRIVQHWQRENEQAFHWNDNNKKTIRDLLRYFLRDELSEYDVNKGVFLFGDFGRGKTLLMRLFSIFTTTLNVRPFVMCNCKDIVVEVSKVGNLEPLENYFRGVKCFDDLGFEDAGFKVFGNNVSVMEYILNHRCESGWMTHVTTNLTPDMIEQYYGERIASRIYQMFNFVELDGVHDFRKTQTKKHHDKQNG